MDKFAVLVFPITDSKSKLYKDPYKKYPGAFKSNDDRCLWFKSILKIERKLLEILTGIRDDPSKIEKYKAKLRECPVLGKMLSDMEDDDLERCSEGIDLDSYKDTLRLEDEYAHVIVDNKHGKYLGHFFSSCYKKYLKVTGVGVSLLVLAERMLGRGTLGTIPVLVESTRQLAKKKDCKTICFMNPPERAISILKKLGFTEKHSNYIIGTDKDIVVEYYALEIYE